jgi:hypothetical protein
MGVVTITEILENNVCGHCETKIDMMDIERLQHELRDRINNIISDLEILTGAARGIKEFLE